MSATSTMNRRRALQSTACVGALALPAGVAVAATGDPDHPLLLLWREVLELTDAYDRSGEADAFDAPHYGPIWQKLMAAEASAVSCSSTCANRASSAGLESLSLTMQR